MSISCSAWAWFILCFGINDTNQQLHRELTGTLFFSLLPLKFCPQFSCYSIIQLLGQSLWCLWLSQCNSCIVHEHWETFPSPLIFLWEALIFEHHLSMIINSVWWFWINVFPLWLQLRAFEDIWLGLTGTAASSSVQSQILVEGIIDQKEKVKVAASKGKECFQYYMGYLQGMYLTDHALSLGLHFR